MYSRDDLLNDFKKIGINPQGTLLIHSSMKAIGEVENRADTVIDAFMEYMKDGLLIFPTHTWEEYNNKDSIYNPEKETSCVGILTNIFRKRDGVIRSLHPTHSVAAFGKDAEEYVKGEETMETPTPREGCWGRLYDKKAQILFLGCSLKRNTYIHSVEEWSNVPGRLADKYTHYKIVKPDGELIDSSIYRHEWGGVDISDNYDKLLKAFLYKGIAKEGKIGDALSYLCDAKAMGDLVTEFLKKDIDVLTDDRPLPEEWYL
ncbi:AAC(3) family N-acetyltransferase [Natronospora cellulosivora (SeqCode)]